MVSPDVLSSSRSTSKLRHERAAVTKQRLYESSRSNDVLIEIRSQVAMLTTSVDSLQSLFWYFLHCGQQYNHSGMHGNMEHQQEYKSESGYQRAKSNQHDQKKHRDGARDNPKPNESQQKDCDSDTKVSFPTTGSWEPLDPWLFLDRTELGGVSQTCKRSHQLVGEYTPFSLVQQTRCKG